MKAGQSFGHRYRIIRLLGIGGMGAVYKAWDNVLRMAVAIKVMRSSLSDDSTILRLEERFKRELRLARQVTHKNVVRIHDIGEINGIKYITMPYVKGSDLATILMHSDKLPVQRVLGIARQIAEGLQAAHEAGVVHRDLKPANIMIDADDRVLIMDFGLARSVAVEAVSEDTASSTDSSVADPSGISAPPLDPTRFGAVIGTIAYMSPEQARGQTIDHRADIYAFGLLLRQMLLGGIWKGHPSEMTVSKLARLDSPPDSLRKVDPGIPAALDRLIIRCLQPNGDRRYQSMTEVISELDSLGEAKRGFRVPIVLSTSTRIGALVLVVLALGVVLWLVTVSRPTEPAEPVELSLDVRTNPAGATVQLDGRRLSRETPLEVSLSPSEEHDLVISKDGYESQTLHIVPGEELPSGEIALTPVMKQGTLVVTSYYLLSVLSSRGKTLAERSSQTSITLGVGRHQIRLYAPEVFLNRVFTVEIREGRREDIEAPALGKVSIRASPGNCLVTINGVPAEALPVDKKDIVAGISNFVFTWPDGQKQEITEEVRPGRHTYVTGWIR